MPNTKMTMEKFKVHMHYNKLIYVVIIVVSLLLGNLLFTVTAYRAPNARRVDIELIGNYAQTESEAAKATLARLLEAGQAYERAADSANGIDTAAADYEPALQDVQYLIMEYTGNTSDESSYYAMQKYMVTLAAQEGDIFVLGRDMLSDLAEQNLLVPLDDYIDEGILKVNGRNLARVTFNAVNDEGAATGGQHVYALQADQMTGFWETLQFDMTDKYVCIMAYSQNPDTAAAVLGELQALFEPEQAEEGAQPGQDGAAEAAQS